MINDLEKIGKIWKKTDIRGMFAVAVFVAVCLSAGGCSLLPHKKNATSKPPVRPSSVSTMDDFMMLERP